MRIKKKLIISMLAVLTALLLSSHAGAALLVANNETDKTIRISIGSWKMVNFLTWQVFEAYNIILAPGQKRRINPSEFLAYAVKSVSVTTEYDEEYETLGSLLAHNGNCDEWREVGFKNWNSLYNYYGASVTCRNDEGSFYNIKCDIYPL